MPIFKLNAAIQFPPAECAEPEGILAIGGDLAPKRLVNAYAHGIFPWYSAGEPIMWWSPDPRCVIVPSAVHVSASMQKVIKKKLFKVTFDRDFAAVIAACQRVPRQGQDGTWITAEMEAAYTRMAELGYGHSIECWQGDDLVGGLYGIALGRCFFGESMFSAVTNASKMALIMLCRALQKMNFHFLDCQLPTPHLKSLGAIELSRDRYLVMLNQALQYPTRLEKWQQ